MVCKDLLTDDYEIGFYTFPEEDLTKEERELIIKKLNLCQVKEQ